MGITVDSELAKLMLTKPYDNKVTYLFKTYQNNSLDTKTLSEITHNYSVDLATLYFLQRAYQVEKNKKVQDDYIKFFQQ
jgi:hypothetical protein